MLCCAVGKENAMRPYAPRHVREGCSVKPSVHVMLMQARANCGLTQQQVADACSINIRQYQKFESGERDLMGCAFSLGLALCRTLGIDPQSLFDAAPAANRK